MTNDLAQVNLLFRRIMNRRAARRRNAHFDPETGKLVAVPARNRVIHDFAHIREPIAKGVELWISYHAAREEFLRLRERPIPGLELATELCDPDALNGYVAFPKRHAPRLPGGIDHIVRYIPVHGGVTWARKDSFAAVWGFDTMHAGSEDQPRTSPDWIRANCELLYRGLLECEQLYPKYRRATQAERAQIAQHLLDALPEYPLMDKMGFGALISVMTGEL